MTQPGSDGRPGYSGDDNSPTRRRLNSCRRKWINAHRTSTHANDSAESKAIAKVFADNDHYQVKCTKSRTGHLLEAAGAIEAVATIAALQNDVMPVNVGLQVKDPEVNIPLVTEESRRTKVNHDQFIHSFGFGGHNAVLAFKR